MFLCLVSIELLRFDSLFYKNHLLNEKPEFKLAPKNAEH